MPEFDFHARIERLAEAEWERQCPCICHVKAKQGLPIWHNAICIGEEDRPQYIVPFAALRVTCADCCGKGKCHNLDGPGLESGCDQCGGGGGYRYGQPGAVLVIGRGWVPEPDVRVACWEVRKVLPARYQPVLLGGTEWGWTNPDGRNHSANSCEEATLRSAGEYVKEQQEDREERIANT